ncbi:hypothetical protein DM806_02655 [Sphingobium lactosutens]|uniref:hypothetical protein n=1 Tax=Sphingobium lactosutens TaxID=522773 RepID=UPI0015BEBDF7|nr:hypothetical protein [Sphingobium lactosutens]NWK94587.1 hypothetical protein [Sphingobium lactosutens]
MSIRAFGGDAARKSAMVEAVRPRWESNALLPATILKWDADSEIHSLGGALAETDDRATFEEKTGIPLECAMLCEALMALAVDISADPTSAQGFSMRGPSGILSFGMEWLDAVRPGADLSEVVPQFAAYILGIISSDVFALAGEIEPPVKAVAAQIHALWLRELAGETIASSEWSIVRRKAMAATTSNRSLFGHTIATFVESVAWPVRSLAPEFVALFQTVLVTWMTYLQRPFFSEEEQRDQDHAMIGWQRIDQVSREGGSDEDMQAALDALPESKRVMESTFAPDVKARRAEVQEQARIATDPMLREQMNIVLKLIADA